MIGVSRPKHNMLSLLYAARLQLLVFFLRGYVKERVYILPLPADLDELKNRITAAVKSVTEDTLRRVWEEFSYRVDVVRAAGGGHRERL